MDDSPHEDVASPLNFSLPGASSTFTGQSFTLFPEDHDQPFPPVIVLDESTPTGVIPVSSDHSVPGPGSAPPLLMGQEWCH